MFYSLTDAYNRSLTYTTRLLYAHMSARFVLLTTTAELWETTTNSMRGDSVSVLG